MVPKSPLSLKSQTHVVIPGGGVGLPVQTEFQAGVPTALGFHLAVIPIEQTLDLSLSPK